MSGAAAGWPERATLAALGLAGIVASLVAAPGLEGGLGALLAPLALAVAAIDRRRLIIPDALNAAIFGFGIAAALLEGADDPGAATLAALARAGGAAAIFFVIRFAYRRLRGREGLGLGDVKLAGAAGPWLDASGLPLAVEIAALAALLLVGLDAARRRAAPDALAKLPFGAFFAPAVWIVWLIERRLS